MNRRIEPKTEEGHVETNTLTTRIFLVYIVDL